MLTEEYGDMVELGVIDPAKVTRGALENAASIAAMILTTEALITDIPLPKARLRPCPRAVGCTKPKGFNKITQKAGHTTGFLVHMLL